MRNRTVRRWLPVVALLGAIALVGAACGEEEPTTPAGTPSDQAPTFETIEEGKLLVGSCLDYPPFESVKNGEPTGFDVDISTEIADRLGLEIEFIKANFDNIFTDLAGGKFDMVAAASTITAERQQIVDFSDPYFNSRQGLTVNTAETPDIATTDDLGEGDVVGAQKGTTGLAWAKDNLASQGVEIKTYDAAPEAFTQLEGGAITAVVNDEGSSIAEVEQRSDLEVVQAIDTDEKYGLALSKDNPDLTEAINGALAEIIEDGTYAQLFTKYFPDQPVPEEFMGA